MATLVCLAKSRGASRFLALVRSCYQACEKFSRIAIVEIIISWFFFMPILWLALLYATPFLFFAAYIGKEAIIALWLRYAITREAPHKAQNLFSKN